MTDNNRFADITSMIGVLSVAGILLFGLSQHSIAQNAPPSIDFDPRSYVCYQISDSLNIDGQLEKAWEQAPWTSNFVDIEGDSKPAPRYQTRAKMLWDERYLYIAARLEEPHVWASLQKRDAVIFHNNNFEVFIDPDGDTHQYYELEINALGAFWDLMLPEPYRDGGNAIDAWDIRGLKTGIAIQGTLNNPADTDSGWTVELAIPWKVLEESAPRGEKPAIGDRWRINFSRVEWEHTIKNGEYERARDDSGELLTEDNWVWSPQGIINMHYPEMWGYVQFAGPKEKAGKVSFEWRDERWIKWYLRQLYYRQHQQKGKDGLFTSQPGNIQAVEIFRKSKLPELFPDLSLPKIHATQQTFEIRLPDPGNDRIWYIREDGKVWSTEYSSRKSDQK